MTQNLHNNEAGAGPDGSIFLPTELTLQEINSEMFKLFQDRDTARGLSFEEKQERAVELDRQKARLLGQKGLNLVVHNL